TSNNWFAKNLAGNWEFVPVYTYESPEYVDVQSGLDSNLNGDSAGDRTIDNLSGVPGTGSGVYGLTRTGAVIPTSAKTAQLATVVAWVATNPNAQYIQAGPGAFANVGRNTLATRPINDIDLSLIKHFSFKDRYRVDLEGQALNLLNHPQFIPGSINNTASVSGYTNGALAYVSAASANFNNPTLPFSSNPRILQVVARFNW
ncbi:MAG: hypothetical protein JO108_31775, partial [Acidobacteriaceae bacterium]|nr:hypothetical protein [Acidobacteriaceae bacterium]